MAAILRLPTSTSKNQKSIFSLYHERMPYALDIRIDRSAASTLTEQICFGILAAIRSGALAPGARLPSWQALAAQLGIARGTVKSAYERLADEQVIVSSRPGGTRVAEHPATARAAQAEGSDAVPELYQHLFVGPAMFQMGVPASDCFPVSLFARLRAHAARREVAAPAVYPDPRGESEFRREIAAHLALARGIECRPSQIFVTAGFAGALEITLRVLRVVAGATAWMENPGFFHSRRALELAQLVPVSVPVDDEGLDVAYGVEHFSNAALALVTPGQQAPLGGTLSLSRRVALVEWAARTDAWVIEDDYLGELQLRRRAAPALASLDGNGRVIHIGSFSKTISPSLRLGFIVAPADLIDRFNEAVMCMGSSPGPAVQQATARFMGEGHYMRHLRRMKRVYSARGEALRIAMERKGYQMRIGGLAAIVHLPDDLPDVAVAKEARALGLAPEPLSTWFASGGARKSGLLLGIATADETKLSVACERLDHLIRQHR